MGYLDILTVSAQMSLLNTQAAGKVKPAATRTWQSIITVIDFRLDDPQREKIGFLILDLEVPSTWNPSGRIPDTRNEPRGTLFSHLPSILFRQVGCGRLRISGEE